MFVGEFDEDVFEARSEGPNFGDNNALLLELGTKVVEFESVVDERMNGLTKNCGAADTGNSASGAESLCDVGCSDFDAIGSVRVHVGKFAKSVRSAVSNDFAKIDVGNVIAALRFVHVVGGHEKSDAVSGEFEEKVPELAASDGIDAGGGFVEKNQGRFMEHGATESKTLFPATGELGGEAIQIRPKTVDLDDFIHAPTEMVIGKAIDAAVKSQIFRNGEIGVEAEILGHVADIFADGFGVFPHVDTLNRGVAGRKR
jgi:hypothetical protein